MTRVACLAAALLSSCATFINPVTFTSAADAPSLPARPDGCFVDVTDENTPLTRPHRIVGTLALEWDATRGREQGAGGALKALQSSACERGGHFVMNLRVLPRGFALGVLYEADLAVLLDEQGRPVVGAQSNTATSSGERTGTAPPAP